MTTLRRKKKTQYGDILLCILAIFAAFGTSIALTIGGFNLSPARILIPIAVVITFWKSQRITKFNRQAIKFIFVWILFALVTTAISFDVRASIDGLLNYLFFFALVIIISINVKSVKTLDRIVFATTALLIAFSILGYVESVTGVYFFPVQADIETIVNNVGLHYPIAIFYNTNDFMFFLLGIIPFLFNALNRHSSKHKYIRILLKTAYLANVIILSELAMCRMAFVVLALMFAVYLFTRRDKRAFFFFCIFAVIGAIVIIGSGKLPLTDIATDARFDIWNDAMNNLKMSHFLGVGINNANIKVEGIIYNSWILKSHCWFVETLAEFGLVFFAILMVTLFMLWLNCYKTLNKYNKNISTLSNQVVTFMILFVAMSIMSASVAQNMFLWLYFALAVASVNLKKQEELVYKQERAFAPSQLSSARMEHNKSRDSWLSDNKRRLRAKNI